MEAGEIDTQQKQKKLLDGYAEELFEKRLEWVHSGNQGEIQRQSG